ncbi:guanine nucleotide-binding protein subunit gamma [Vararia minispora EC-137]|uniref:Guanine nucleotide-binding protein subunit gamma n=1 Tax=Vararia minispora EC-137 TaxID=1314806 RepID=A0ACB8QS41_9AGAM|nr:guanine nucleotide-binding protein subunit gamma [Vararia minispora EC-137]
MSTRGNTQKLSIYDLKLRRLLEHNQRLKDDLSRPRLHISEASTALIRYCKMTKDYLVPSVWGTVSKGEDPYAPQATQPGCVCTVM